MSTIERCIPKLQKIYNAQHIKEWETTTVEHTLSSPAQVALTRDSTVIRLTNIASSGGSFATEGPSIATTLGDRAENLSFIEEMWSMSGLT